MNSLMKNTHHINKLPSTLYNILRKVQQTRSFLDTDTPKIIMQELVLSKLDYYNSLLLGSSELQLDELHRIQNRAFQVIFNLKKYDHISAQLKSLHWLNVWGKIVYKCKVGTTPKYLQNLLPKCNRTRQLQSSSSEYVTPTYIQQEHKNPQVIFHHRSSSNMEYTP